MKVCWYSYTHKKNPMPWVLGSPSQYNAIETNYLKRHTFSSVHSAQGNTNNIKKCTGFKQIIPLTQEKHPFITKHVPLHPQCLFDKYQIDTSYTHLIFLFFTSIISKELKCHVCLPALVRQIIPKCVHQLSSTSSNTTFGLLSFA